MAYLYSANHSLLIPLPRAKEEDDNFGNKRKLLVTYAWPTTSLEHVSHLEHIHQDINRPYMKDVMGSSFSFLLTTSMISLNAPEFVQIAPALQTAFIVSVSSIIIIIYSIV